MVLDVYCALSNCLFVCWLVITIRMIYHECCRILVARSVGRGVAGQRGDVNTLGQGDLNSRKH